MEVRGREAGGEECTVTLQINEKQQLKVSLQLAFQWAIKPLNWVLNFEGFWTCEQIYLRLCFAVNYLCKWCSLCAHCSLSRCNLSSVFHSIKHVKPCLMHLVVGFPWWLLVEAFVLVSKIIVCLLITPLWYRIESHQQDKLGTLLDSTL